MEATGVPVPLYYIQVLCIEEVITTLRLDVQQAMQSEQNFYLKPVAVNTAPTNPNNVQIQIQNDTILFELALAPSQMFIEFRLDAREHPDIVVDCNYNIALFDGKASHTPISNVLQFHVSVYKPLPPDIQQLQQIFDKKHEVMLIYWPLPRNTRGLVSYQVNISKKAKNHSNRDNNSINHSTSVVDNEDEKSDLNLDAIHNSQNVSDAILSEELKHLPFRIPVKELPVSITIQTKSKLNALEFISERSDLVEIGSNTHSDANTDTNVSTIANTNVIDNAGVAAVVESNAEVEPHNDDETADVNSVSAVESVDGNQSKAAPAPEHTNTNTNTNTNSSSDAISNASQNETPMEMDVDPEPDTASVAVVVNPVNNKEPVPPKTALLLADLPLYVQACLSFNPGTRFEGIHKIRQLLSVDSSVLPIISNVIDSGVVPKLVQLLATEENPRSKFEAAWAITNIASGTSAHTACLIRNGAIPIFVKLLQTSKCKELLHQVVWGLGNLAGDSAECRDVVLHHEALQSIWQLLRDNYGSDNEGYGIALLRKIAWILSNLMRGSPPPALSAVKVAAQAMMFILNLGATSDTVRNDEEIHADICWALKHITEVKDTSAILDVLLNSGAVKKVIELMGNHEKAAVREPALKCIGNVMSATDDRYTQFCLDHGVLDQLAKLLRMRNTSKLAKKEICWNLSNITAGTAAQIEQVIGADLIAPVIALLGQGNPFEVRKEAVWVLANVTAGGTAVQIRFLVNDGVIPPLVTFVDCLGRSGSRTHKILLVALEGMGNILAAGALQAIEKNGVNPYADFVEDAGGIDCLENLQSIEVLPAQIYDKVQMLIRKYFGGAEETECVWMDDNAKKNEKHSSSNTGEKRKTMSKRGRRDAKATTKTMTTAKPSNGNGFAFAQNNNNNNNNNSDNSGCPPQRDDASSILLRANELILNDKFKITTKDRIIFQHRPAHGFRFDASSRKRWRKRGSGQITIYYNNESRLTRLIFVDEKHVKTRLLQIINNENKARLGTGEETAVMKKTNTDESNHTHTNTNTITNADDRNNTDLSVSATADEPQNEPNTVYWHCEDYTMSATDPLTGDWKLKFDDLPSAQAFCSKYNSCSDIVAVDTNNNFK